MLSRTRPAHLFLFPVKQEDQLAGIVLNSIPPTATDTVLRQDRTVCRMSQVWHKEILHNKVGRVYYISFSLSSAVYMTCKGESSPFSTIDAFLDTRLYRG